MTNQPPQWPPAPPGWDGGGNGGWGGPAPYGPPPGYGWGPGYPPPRRGDKRLRLAFGLGLGSLGCGVGAVAAAIFGVLTFLFGGAMLFVVAAALVLAGFGLAVSSVVLAVLARGAPALKRVGAATPALVTLFVAGSFLLSGTVGIGGGDDRRRDYDSRPDRAVEDAARALWFGDPDEVCELLAAAAAGDRCDRDGRLRGDFELSGNATVLSERGSRALVRYQPGGRSPHRVRLVLEEEGWRLLDLPGRYDECVDTAADPFGCPVVRYGRPS